MKGLYILVNPVLRILNTIKIGMSMRLEERIFDYDVCFAGNEYVYCYELDTTKDIILTIESHILECTKNMNNMEYFTTEYRKVTEKFSVSYYHNLIISSLNECEIQYNVHNNPKFKKQYNEKSEPLDLTNELRNTTESEYRKLVPHIRTTPNEQQKIVIENIETFYETHDIGKIIWACGLGKALLCIMIAEKLHSKTVVIGVPSIYLQKQMRYEIIKIFPETKNILHIGSECDNSINATTDPKTIKQFIESKKNGCKFIITTYDSCYLLANSYTFDFKVGDESHHLVGIMKETDKSYQMFHKIKTLKTLFMTATEKIIDSVSNEVYTMDDKNIFGELIDSKSISWAIENKKITDYNVLILNNTDREIQNIIELLHIDCENRELLCSAYMTLKSMEEYQNSLSHILIYTNNTNNANKVKYYIDVIMSSGLIKIPLKKFYNKSLHSKNDTDLISEIKTFEKSRFGIISCVYIFGEGFDLPKLNGVTFAENMDSDIRIVQSTLRANRINRTRPDKIAYVILPYIDTCEHKSFNRCIKIISKLRCVDETVTQKIKFMKLSYNGCVSNDNVINLCNYELIDDPIELSNIKIKLINSKALNSKLSPEQLEYNYVRQINISLKLKSKEDYVHIKKTHKHYIDNPESYFGTKMVWINWTDFLGIDTNKFIQSKEEWIKFCKEKNVQTLLDYDKLCDTYSELPRHPSDFYKGFVNIQTELKFHSKRRYD